MLRSQQRHGARRSRHQREQHRPIPTGLFRLITHLIHRKFWFLGLFLWPVGLAPFHRIPKRLVPFGFGEWPFLNSRMS
jgi:hypothetical protein